MGPAPRRPALPIGAEPLGEPQGDCDDRSRLRRGIRGRRLCLLDVPGQTAHGDREDAAVSPPPALRPFVPPPQTRTGEAREGVLDPLSPHAPLRHTPEAPMPDPFDQIRQERRERFTAALAALHWDIYILAEILGLRPERAQRWLGPR